jgi:excisionase family DNA binding protein
MKTNPFVDNQIENSLLRPSDVARRLNISTSFAYRLMQFGDIPSVRIRGACRVRPQNLEEYIKCNLHNSRSGR